MDWFTILGAFWLGFSLALFSDLSIRDWKFWAILVPTITFLVVL